MKILLTGGAGFIGFHVAKRLLEQGHKVVSVDNFNDYYDISLKKARSKILEEFPGFEQNKVDISNYEELKEVFSRHGFDKICNLAAQAGVRYSLENPFVYPESNVVGFLNVLELARENGVKDIVYASSSSVYGGRKNVPFAEQDNVDKPISLYAATKKSNELIAHAYSHIYGMNCIGLRFFTVYGPFGRPDMAYFKFVKSILDGKPIDVYNYGKQDRDFTYVDDIADGVLKALNKSFKYEVINLARGHPEKLMDFIGEIEKNLGVEAEKNMLTRQPGDVDTTFGDTTKAKYLLGYEPKVSLSEGIKKFVEWYKEYYKL